MRTIVLTLLVLFISVPAAGMQIPDYYIRDGGLDKSLHKIAEELGLDGDFYVGKEDGIQQLSLAVVDLNAEKPVFAGVTPESFVYPASVYKMFVAAEVLRQISDGKYDLDTFIEVKSPNDVDTSKEILTDPRPLLHDGDNVTVNYLLDLMITRSDNSASNVLIDLARRENINQLVDGYNWQGSEVTRKFLGRQFEDPGYEDIRGTEMNALHAVDFMYRTETDQLVNPWVSRQMKTLLGRQLDKSKYAQGLPRSAMFYHKTGWFACWTNDVGIVEDGDLKYAVAVLMPVEEDLARPKYKLLAEKIHALMKERFEAQTR